jgi:hypothetical protein
MIDLLIAKLMNRKGVPLAWIEDSGGNVWLRVIRHSLPFDTYVCRAGHFGCQLKLGPNGHTDGCVSIERWKPANGMGVDVARKIERKI